jgi:hypothetical protein
LIGSCPTNTFVQLSGATNSSAAFYVLASTTDNPSVHISDLTIDCNYGASGVTAASIAGLNVNSSAGTIERVRVLNYGASNGDVSIINWMPTSAGTGAFTIQDCRIEGAVKGGGGSTVGEGIVIWGNSSSAATQRTNVNVIVRNNHISNIGAGYGIDIVYGANNVLVDGNVIVGVSKGISADWGAVNNLQIANNILENVGLGISAGHQSSSNTNIDDGLLIANNLIEVNGSLPAIGSSYFPGGIRLSGGVRNGTIKNNLVQVAGSARSTNNPNWYSLLVNSLNSSLPNTNIVVIGNTLCPTLAKYFEPIDISFMSGNHMLDGTQIDPFASYTAAIPDTTNTITLDGTPSLHQWVPTIWVACAASWSAMSGQKVVHIPDPYYYQGKTFNLFLYKSPTAATNSIALQADSNGWGGSYTNQVIIEPKTGGVAAVGSPYSVYGSGSSWLILPVRVTSIGGSWMLEK